MVKVDQRESLRKMGARRRRFIQGMGMVVRKSLPFVLLVVLVSVLISISLGITWLLVQLTSIRPVMLVATVIVVAAVFSSGLALFVSKNDHAKTIWHLLIGQKSTSERISEVYRRAKRVDCREDQRFIIFSDAHRGVNDWADDFTKNHDLVLFALRYYYDRGYTYVEAGDGDELWENSNFAEIQRSHRRIYEIMRSFHLDGRLHLLFGNHDIERKCNRIVRKHLHSQYKIGRPGERMELFEGIEVHEGLILSWQRPKKEILVIHGHQGSPVNDKHWRVGRLAVRTVWKHLQNFGVPDATRPSEDHRRRGEVQRRITEWIIANETAVICGHTHKPRFPLVGAPRYFNAGSCVHPRSVTGIEIAKREISLVKWWIGVNRDNDQDAASIEDVAELQDALFGIRRTVLGGPMPLVDLPSKGVDCARGQPAQL